MTSPFTESPVLFRDEKACGRRWWPLWAFGGLSTAQSVGMLAFFRAVKPPAAEDMGSLYIMLLALPAGGVLLGAAFTYLTGTLKLTVEVRPDGLYLRYFPFHRSFRKMPLDNAVRCSAVMAYGPREYGGWVKKGRSGWGIRVGWKEKAYITSGSSGVRIDYDNGRHLLIDSDRPEELCAAIEKLLPQRV
jgi:hypothetical protein